jgi:hypothetical protein
MFGRLAAGDHDVARHMRRRALKWMPVRRRAFVIAPVVALAAVALFAAWRARGVAPVAPVPPPAVAASAPNAVVAATGSTLPAPAAEAPGPGPGLDRPPDRAPSSSPRRAARTPRLDKATTLDPYR